VLYDVGLDVLSDRIGRKLLLMTFGGHNAMNYDQNNINIDEKYVFDQS
jgi:hypothetical protein